MSGRPLLEELEGAHAPRGVIDHPHLPLERRRALVGREGPGEQGRQGVALVLAGGGARGAYEAGALSVLLPALEAEGRRPTILVGTSAGAINAAALASLGHLDAATAADTVLGLWRAVNARSVYHSPLRADLAALLSRGRAGGPARATALLDTDPLLATLGRLIDWNQLHENIGAGRLSSVAVVATSWSTRRSVVFLERAPGVTSPPSDEARAIDFVPTTLEPRHVLASSALPVLFPAVRITHPTSSADWYIDGGVRLNTPIKPALSLRAQRVVVIATAPGLSPPRRPEAPPGPAPGTAGGAARLLSTVLDDRMLEDLRTLSTRNEDTTPAGVAGDDQIPWLFVGPVLDDTDLFARLVGEVLTGCARGHRARRLIRRTLGRLMARDPSRLELASYLCFDPDFIDGAIRLGQRDGRRALDATGGARWQDDPEVPASALGRP